MSHYRAMSDAEYEERLRRAMAERLDAEDVLRIIPTQPQRLERPARRVSPETLAAVGRAYDRTRRRAVSVWLVVCAVGGAAVWALVWWGMVG